MFLMGIDAEDICRFSKWHTFDQNKLLKIFSTQEIAYCLKDQAKSPERFAARWCAKEASYKALKKHFLKPISYGYFCKQLEIASHDGAPEIVINWDYLPVDMRITQAESSISITHTKNTAIAVVIFTGQFNGS